MGPNDLHSLYTVDVQSLLIFPLFHIHHSTFLSTVWKPKRKNVTYTTLTSESDEKERKTSLRVQMRERERERERGANYKAHCVAIKGSTILFFHHDPLFCCCFDVTLYVVGVGLLSHQSCEPNVGFFKTKTK